MNTNLIIIFILCIIIGIAISMQFFSEPNATIDTGVEKPKESFVEPELIYPQYVTEIPQYAMGYNGTLIPEYPYFYPYYFWQGQTYGDGYGWNGYGGRGGHRGGHGHGGHGGHGHH
jgi:hypothetical protein